MDSDRKNWPLMPLHPVIIDIVTPWKAEDFVQFQTTPIPKELYQWKRGTEDAFCFDIRSNIDLVIDKGKQAKVPTGLFVAMPPPIGLIMRERSGLADKGFQLGAGTIDADYRGQIFALLRYEPKIDVLDPNRTLPDSFKINRGDRICQAWFANVDPRDLMFNIVETSSELSKTGRGEGGYGSTGMR